jgi:hypothetical protein
MVGNAFPPLLHYFPGATSPGEHPRGPPAPSRLRSALSPVACRRATTSACSVVHADTQPFSANLLSRLSQAVQTAATPPSAGGDAIQTIDTNFMARHPVDPRRRRTALAVPGPATGTGHHGAAGAGRLVVTAARAVTTRRPWSPDPCSARSASRPTRPGRAGSATAHSTNTKPPVPNCSPTRVPQLNGAPGHADRHRRRSRPARRPKPLDTRSNRVRANHQQRCRRGAYTGRATSDHNRGLADIPLKFLTAASASRPAVPHDRSRTSRVDSLRDTAPAVASRPRDPGCPAARPSFGHTSTFTRDNSA